MTDDRPWGDKKRDLAVVNGGLATANPRISGAQIGIDQTAAFANSALVNTQVNVDFTAPVEPSLLHVLTVENPSTVSDFTVKVFNVVAALDGATQYAYLCTLAVPKAQAITGTTITTYMFEIEGLFASGGVRLVVSNDTALGAADGDSLYFRLRKL